MMVLYLLLNQLNLGMIRVSIPFQFRSSNRLSIKIYVLVAQNPSLDRQASDWYWIQVQG